MKINNKEYEDLFQLAKDMYLDSTFYAKELRNESFLDMIKSIDNRKYTIINNLSLLSLPDDIFVFKASYVLNPFMSFRFRGYIFEDYQKLGEKMLNFSPNPNPILSEIVRHSLVSQHMGLTYYNNDHKEIFNQVIEIEKLSEKNLTYAYYCLSYYLSKKKSIIFNGVEYKDLFNFTYYALKNGMDLDNLGAYLSKSPLISAYKDYSDDKEGLIEYLHLCKEVEKSQQSLINFLNKKKEENNQF